MTGYVNQRITVAGEVTGWCQQKSTLSILRLWGLSLHGHRVVNFFHFVGGFSICRTMQQTCNRHCYQVLQGGTENSVTAVWLIYYLNS